MIDKYKKYYNKKFQKSMGASCTCLNQTKEKTDYILDSNKTKEIGK